MLGCPPWSSPLPLQRVPSRVLPLQMPSSLARSRWLLRPPQLGIGKRGPPPNGKCTPNIQS
eukprot:6083702-Amphidinium_carterae.1